MAIVKKKVIYSGFHSERQYIIDHLYKQYGWEPVFFICMESSRKWAKKNYPDAVFSGDMAMRQGHFDYSRIGSPVPVDAQIIGRLSKYELNCINDLLEDTTGWNFSFVERRCYYYEMLKYWNTVIERLKPDLFVAFTWPHNITDYSLYLFCKHYYSIDVLFLDPMPLLNSNFHLIGNALEDLSAPFRKLYESDEPLKPGVEVTEYLAQVRSEKWATPKHNLVDVMRWEKQKGFQYKEFARILVYLMLGKAFHEGHMAFKKNRRPIDSPKSRLTHFDYFWFKDRLRRKDMELRKIYATFCVQPDFKKKYIYFAASQQPEAVTSINGGVYEDLMLAIGILSASIPSDWVIYFKEHPGNFYPTSKGSLSRSRYYYEKIKAFKNVQMISHEIDTFKLIDHAQAVASVAGTSSWEAAVRNKPGLFFGNVWYQGCRSLFRIETLQDCRNAINKIVNGYMPDQKDIERYLTAIEKVAVKDLIHWNFCEKIKECPDPKYELERIAKVLNEAYERYYTLGGDG